MNTHLTTALAAALLTCPPVTAAEFGPDYLPEDEPFYVGWVEEHQGCYAWSTDNSLSVLVESNSFKFGLRDREWSGLEEQEVTVALHFTEDEVFAGDAFLSNGLLVFAPSDDRLEDFLYQWATRSYVTLVTARGHEFSFSLNGTMAALEALWRCYGDHLDTPADTSADNPF